MSPLTVSKAAISVIMLLVVTTIFTDAFGSIILGGKLAENQQDVRSSQLIYLIASIIGQTAYPIFSKMQGGSLVLPTFDNISLIRKIYRDDEHRTKGSALINTLFSLSSASLLSGALSLLLFFSGVAKYVQNVPQTIICVLMIRTSIGLLYFGSSPYNNGQKIVMVGHTALSFFITFLAMLIVKKTRKPLYLLYYVFFLIALFNIIRMASGGSRTWLGQQIFCSDSEAIALSYRELLDCLALSELDLRRVLRHWSKIIVLSIHPFLMHTINLPAYNHITSVSYNFETELAALGVANCCSSLAPFPVYFNCSGSAMFHAAGGDSSLCSVIGGLGCILLYFTFHRVRNYLPVFVTSLLVLFAAVSFLLLYLKNILRSSYHDALLIVFTLALSIFFDLGTFTVIAIVAAYEFFVQSFFSRSLYVFRAVDKVLTPENRIKIVITGPLNFYNISSLAESIRFCEKTGQNRVIEIDLSKCTYVDMSANMKLKEMLDDSESNDVKYSIKGNPVNFYRHFYKSSRRVVFTL